MDRKLFALGVVGLLALACGCSNTVPATDFISRYTTNVVVPNPADSHLPIRTFYGSDGAYFTIKDMIPYSQGGKDPVFGTTITYTCPVGALPRNFPQAFKPGDVVLDGRKDTKYTYMIEWYRANGGEDRPPTNEWAGQPPQSGADRQFKPRK